MRKREEVTIADTNYELVKEIGGGGSGVVWEVRSDGKEYAVKFLNSDCSKKNARFYKEIEFCKNNTHKNIVRVIANGVHNCKPCYVMPLYHKTLKDLIKTENDADVLIRYILKLCEALKHIHSKGIFHRDIKPENILIENNELVLADFGIAHFIENKLTKKGDLLANRNYASPEQKDKKNVNSIDASADIYALGLIINECFTKENPSGSYFRLIADSHPLYADFDKLVANMIKQNPVERISINPVITEIKFIQKKIKQSLDFIGIGLMKQMEFLDIKKTVMRKIVLRASEDILFGKILFNSKSTIELEKYNHNWHMKIGYSVDDFLFNLYVQEQIHSLCKNKFQYESNVYRRGHCTRTLDLANNDKHKVLYEQINDVIAKYKLSKNEEGLFDKSGEILKYFSACSDYHCEEILKSIKREEELARYNLKDAPIIWIVKKLKSGLPQNIEYLLKGVNGLFGKYDFDFTEHISINIERISCYLDNRDDVELLDSSNKENEQTIQDILFEFQKRWKVICNKTDENYFSVKFNTYKQYEKFRKYALDLSSPYYIFNGDVVDILKYPNFVGNMVELKIGAVFDIPNTIAKIVGLKGLEDW